MKNEKKLSDMTLEERNQYKYRKAKEHKARLRAKANAYSDDPYLAAIIKAYMASKEAK